ncbi:hypothetical protein GCM10028826_18030 [Mucilaginibacter boryungensis]
MFSHPIWSIIIVVVFLRGAARWFFGAKKISRQQARHMEMLEEQHGLLMQQNAMLQRHEALMAKLEEKQP